MDIHLETSDPGVVSIASGHRTGAQSLLSMMVGIRGSIDLWCFTGERLHTQCEPAQHRPTDLACCCAAGRGLKQAGQQTVVVNTLTLAGIGSDAVNANLADVGLVAGSCTEVQTTEKLPPFRTNINLRSPLLGKSRLLDSKQLTASVTWKRHPCLLQVVAQRLSASTFSVSFSCSMFAFFSGLRHPDPPGLNATISATVSSSKSPRRSCCLPTPVATHVSITLASCQQPVHHVTLYTCQHRMPGSVDL